MNGRGGIVATAAVTMTSSPGAAGGSVLQGAFGLLEAVERAGEATGRRDGSRLHPRRRRAGPHGAHTESRCWTAPVSARAASTISNGTIWVSSPRCPGVNRPFRWSAERNSARQEESQGSLFNQQSDVDPGHVRANEFR